MKYILGLIIIFLFNTHLLAQVIQGCTDNIATNYNALANRNDGSCNYNAASVNLSTPVLLNGNIKETSGLLYHNGLLWTQNDNDDLYLRAIDTISGAIIDSIYLDGLQNVDWEAIAQDDFFFYIGDFGNNAAGNRTDLKIYKVNKNSLTQSLLDVDTILFSYAAQTNFSPQTANTTPFDCEAFVVTSDTIMLFSKNWSNQTTQVYFLSKTPGSYTIDSTISFPVNGLITDAYWHHDKKLITLLGYNQLLSPFVYLIYGWEDDYNFATANKRKINLSGSAVLQAEGIYSHNGLNYWLTSEYFSRNQVTIPASLYQIDLSTYLAHYLQPDTSTNIIPVKLSLNIYPNPTADYVYIASNNMILNWQNIELFDYMGRAYNLPYESINKHTIMYSLQHLPNGLYYVSYQGAVLGQFVVYH